MSSRRKATPIRLSSRSPASLSLLTTVPASAANDKEDFISLNHQNQNNNNCAVIRTPSSKAAHENVSETNLEASTSNLPSKIDEEAASCSKYNKMIEQDCHQDGLPPNPKKAKIIDEVGEFA